MEFVCFRISSNRIKRKDGETIEVSSKNMEEQHKENSSHVRRRGVIKTRNLESDDFSRSSLPSLPGSIHQCTNTSKRLASQSRSKVPRSKLIHTRGRASGLTVGLGHNALLLGSNPDVGTTKHIGDLSLLMLSLYGREEVVVNRSGTEHAGGRAEEVVCSNREEGSGGGVCVLVCTVASDGHAEGGIDR